MAIWSAEIKELEKLYESIKSQLPDLEKELRKLIKAEDENMILLYSRRCLEVLITDLCECELKRDRGTEPLKGIIDKLHKEKKIPPNIIASIHSLNELSTFGTHPKDFDPEQLKPVLSNLDIIIKWYLKYKNIKSIVKDTPGQKEINEEVRREGRKEIQEIPAKVGERRLVSIIALASILIIAAILIYPRIFKQDSLEKLRSTGERIAVAVMPFQNMTNDTTWNVWQDGIQNELITSLTNSEELKVRQTESLNTLIQSKGLTNYASITPSVASKISQKLQADVFIYGSIKQVGTAIRLNALLIDTKTEETFKSFQIDGIAENILHITDSLSTMVKNFLIISKLGKELPARVKYYGYKSTNSPEAFRYFIYGQNAFYSRDFPAASKLFSQALTVDSNFTSPALSLSLTYLNESMDEGLSLINQELVDKARTICIRLYEKRDQMPIETKIITNRLHAILFETPNEEIQYLRQLIELDDQVPAIYGILASRYLALHQWDKAIPEFEKALKICDKWGITPPWIYDYIEHGYAYHEAGQYEKEGRLYKKAEKDFPDDPDLISSQAILSLSKGDIIRANKFIEKYMSILKDQSFPEANIISNLGDIYFEAEIWDKAEEYYRNALLLQPENPGRMNHLAYFLINKDRNIKEGLELVDKALELSPDNYSFLDTKGWGLYKLGKYKEALELLEKSWALKPIYFHEIFLHLEAAKKAVANQKNN